MLVTDMLTQIDAHGFESQSETLKIQAINDAQTDLCSRHPWPFLETLVTPQTSPGTAFLGLQPGYKAAISLLNTTTGNRIKHVRYETVHAAEDIDITRQGEPAVFYHVGRLIGLFPVPDAAYDLKLLYLSSPLVITASGDSLTVPDHLTRIVLQGALAYLYEINDDDQKADRFQRRFEDRIVQAINDVQMRQYSDADSVTVLSEYETYR